MARYIDNGCFFTVQLSRADVETWAESWPCFGICSALWFQFDKRNGDLVDMKQTAGADESGVRALSDDAQAWGELYARGTRVAFAAGVGAE